MECSEDDEAFWGWWLRRRRTSNVRLPLELGSDRREALATRVSEDLQLSIFRHRKKNRQNFRIEKSVFHQFGEVLEDLRPNGRQNQLPRQILLQIDLSWGLYYQKWCIGKHICSGIFWSQNHTTGPIRVWFHTTSWKSHASTTSSTACQIRKLKSQACPRSFL